MNYERHMQKTQLKHLKPDGCLAKALAQGLALLAVGFLLSGCENSSGSSGFSPSTFGDNDPGVVVAMGDSLTTGSALRGPSYPSLVEQMSGKTVINQGVNGALSSDGVNRITDVLQHYKPGYVFILYGVNDVIHISSDNWTIENLRFMIQAARYNLTIPIVGTISPRYRWDGTSRHTSLNERIRQLCKEEKVRLADVEAEFGDAQDLMLPDGLHPNDSGNLIIATVFYEALR